ncbi:MAG: hypothetical protein ACREOK_08065, partial [Gemmatimonadaceae bacterium]
MRKRRVELVTVRRRLELLLKAHYGRDFVIVADHTPPVKWWERFFSDVRSPARSREPVAFVDVDRIVLPSRLTESTEASTAGDRYRLLGMAAAERIVRGSLHAHSRAATPLERELFWVREAVHVDASIVRRVPRLTAAIERARRRLIASRPKMSALTPRERELELLIQRALRTDPSTVPSEFDGGSSADDSLAWARARADSMASLPYGFGGTAPVGHWGIAPRDPVTHPDPNPMMLPSNMMMGSVQSTTPGDEGSADEQSADPEGASPSDSISDEGRQSGMTAGVGDTYDSNRRYPRRGGTPHRYAEWDGDRHRYVPDGVTVWTDVAPSATDGGETLTESAMIARRLRSQFEQLRVQRFTSRRQFSGDALDFAALTDMLVDLRMGRTPDERVYERAHTNRRALAIGVLVDISGSTGNQLEDGARIIDLEKQALFMAHDALEAVGDPYAMFAFAGLGAHDVQVWSLKN